MAHRLRWNDAQDGTSLGFAVRHWPTPTVTGNHNRKGVSKNSGDGLATAVKNWPTPTCHDRKGKSGAKRGKGATGGPCLTMVVGGTLSPMWVEWLMGWPVGWTDCDVLGMDKFRQWFDSHGKH
jgi:DNA (cytosine-5)-methyltransferase 1